MVEKQASSRTGEMAAAGGPWILRVSCGARKPTVSSCIPGTRHLPLEAGVAASWPDGHDDHIPGGEACSTMASETDNPASMA